eukprot:scaffold631_cov378-Prasinococcus_capsulatus_cf.AAC.2
MPYACAASGKVANSQRPVMTAMASACSGSQYLRRRPSACRTITCASPRGLRTLWLACRGELARHCTSIASEQRQCLGSRRRPATGTGYSHASGCWHSGAPAGAAPARRSRTRPPSTRRRRSSGAGRSRCQQRQAERNSARSLRRLARPASEAESAHAWQRASGWTPPALRLLPHARLSRRSAAHGRSGMACALAAAASGLASSKTGQRQQQRRHGRHACTRRACTCRNEHGKDGHVAAAKAGLPQAHQLKDPLAARRRRRGAIRGVTAAPEGAAVPRLLAVVLARAEEEQLDDKEGGEVKRRVHEQRAPPARRQPGSERVHREEHLHPAANVARHVTQPPGSFVVVAVVVVVAVAYEVDSVEQVQLRDAHEQRARHRHEAHHTVHGHRHALAAPASTGARAFAAFVAGHARATCSCRGGGAAAAFFAVAVAAVAARTPLAACEHPAPDVHGEHRGDTLLHK